MAGRVKPIVVGLVSGLVCQIAIARPINDLPTDVRQRLILAIAELGYPDQSACQFLGFIAKWPEFTGLAAYAKAIDKLEVQIRVARSVAKFISDHLRGSQTAFELSDLLAERKANCLGLAQVFYIIGSSLGLSIVPIEALQLQEDIQPDRSVHVSCMVKLSNEMYLMATDLANGQVSSPFILEQEFTVKGCYWHLRSKPNPKGLYRRIRLMPKTGLSAYLWNNRGVAFYESGRLADAVECLKKATFLDPNLSTAYNNLGIVHRQTYNIDAAIHCYTKAIEIDPGYAQAYSNRAVAYISIKQFQQAMEDCNRAICLSPGLSQAYNNRANIYARLGQYDSAIADYTLAIKADPRMVQAYVNRAIVHLITGQTTKARQDLLRALRLDPNLKNKVSGISRRFAVDLAR